MKKHLGKRTLIFPSAPHIISSASVVSAMEGQGPLGKQFDLVLEDDTWGEDSFERAECRMFETAVRMAIEKIGLRPDDIGCLLGGPVGLGTIISALCSGPILQFSLGTLHFDAAAVKHQDLRDSLKVLFRSA